MAVYIQSAIELKNADSPIRINITPMYIGLREYLYKPETTNFFVGSAGDNVPLPFMANMLMQYNRIANPLTKINMAKY